MFKKTCRRPGSTSKLVCEIISGLFSPKRGRRKRMKKKEEEEEEKKVATAAAVVVVVFVVANKA